MTVLRPQGGDIPLPVPGPVSAPYWEGCAAGELRYQRCRTCGGATHTPAQLCAHCASTELEWVVSSGRGEVYTYTIVHRPIAAGQPLPSVIAVISLEDSGGLRMISNLVDVEPAQIEIGMPVELVWEDMSPELAIPRFRPVRR